ncbi:MAG: hypothetical protein Q9174_006534 [Haloplaca sp. 1 TL-2023]
MEKSPHKTTPVQSMRRNMCWRPDRILVYLGLIAILIFLHSGSSPTNRRIDLPPSTPDPLIPAQVWQLYTTVGARNTSVTHQDALKKTKLAANLAATWFPVDGAWSYRFIGTEFGTQFVKDHFRDQQDIVDVYTSLRVPVMASDFLRYLLLAGDGGVYADSDVEMIKPLHEWVPEPYRNVTRAMVGVEKDHPTDDEPEGWSFRFVQHTLMTAKGHPIMVNMVRNITDKMLQLSYEKQVPVEELELHDRDVVRITGPRGFKDVVFEHLSAQVGWSVGWRNVTGMVEPRLFGDTLVVPINYFAAGQQHSGSDGKSPDRRVQHYWSGTWRHWDESMA